MSAATHWKQYPTAGIYFNMPLTIPWLSCIIGGEGGVISAKSAAHTIQCIHVRFGIVIDNLIRHSSLQFRPEAGVASMMVGGDGGIIDLAHTSVFEKVENEYGVYLGIETRFAWRKLRFSLPIRIERTFSFPNRFDTVIVSVFIGYHINL